MSVNVAASGVEGKSSHEEDEEDGVSSGDFGTVWPECDRAGLSRRGHLKGVGIGSGGSGHLMGDGGSCSGKDDASWVSFQIVGGEDPSGDGM